MLINADFSQRIQVTPDDYQWVASPQAGVERVMLDRIGAEKARATSIVRYAPGSYFPVHEHSGGEEILVLSGTFSEGDEHSPAGCYLRNPPGSHHQPSSCEGATIFVKLGQMPTSENRRVRIDTHNKDAWKHYGKRDVCELFSSDQEHVSLQRIASGESVFSTAPNSAEILVIEGELIIDGENLPKGSWLRLPVGELPVIIAGDAGAMLYIKTGHLTGGCVE